MSNESAMNLNANESVHESAMRLTANESASANEDANESECMNLNL